ncbi:MAG: hypothetical protein OXL34_13655 [Gemmatimonadota bacterium]|nr:hypothetical protein [Gemmatimonadota bacterium]
MKQRVRNISSTRHLLSVAALAVLVGAVGCASTPRDEAPRIAETTMETASVQGVGQEIVRRDRITEKQTIPAETDLVWGVLGGVYEQIGIPVTEVDSESMTVGNLGYEARRIDGTRMNTYLDCGTNFGGPLANVYEVTLSILTQLTKVDDEQTEVSTTIAATAKPRTNAGYPVDCTSRQKLEPLIVEKVKEALNLGS